MARRRSALVLAATAVVAGGSGFQRAVDGWRALGAPACLFDVVEAVWAHQRCAVLAYRRDIVPADPSRSPGVLEFVARGWWDEVRPYFLARGDALTADERAALAASPGQSAPSVAVYRLGLVDIELWGSGRGAPS